MQKLLLGAIALLALNACKESTKQEQEQTGMSADTVNTGVQQVVLPAPYATESVRNQSKPIGWSNGKMPQAPAGFVVTKFADSLDNPRWIYVSDNGEIYVAEASREAAKSANRILLFKDANKDGVAESRSIFL